MIHQFSTPAGYDDGVNGLPRQPNGGFVDFRTDVEQEYPLLQQHDMTVADITLAVNLAKEAIYNSGSEMRVFLRTDNADFDKVWGEDPDPTYWAPVAIKAFHEPKALELTLKLWSADVEMSITPIFQYDDVIRKLGRLIRSGDVIYVPFNALGNQTPRYFRVMNASPIGPYRFRPLYLSCVSINISGDLHVHPNPPPRQVGHEDNRR